MVIPTEVNDAEYKTLAIDLIVLSSFVLLEFPIPVIVGRSLSFSS